MSMFTGLMVNFVGFPKNSTKNHVCLGMNQDICQASGEKCLGVKSSHVSIIKFIKGILYQVLAVLFFVANHQNCHFWGLKEELKKTEKDLKEKKAIKIFMFET